MTTITPVQATSGIAAPISWTGAATGDTFTENAYFGGKATIEVKGTFGGATVQIQYGMVSGSLADLDTTEHPAGAKFTSAGVCNVDLAPGFIKPTITGGAASGISVVVTFIRT